jgi:hypothetical protein
MKTTLELPDDLYREAKTRAASQKRKVRDLVSEGLKALLAATPYQDAPSLDAAKQVLAALDDIRRCPPTKTGRTAMLQAEAKNLRQQGWSRADTSP